jgi:hypothetical protein
MFVIYYTHKISLTNTILHTHTHSHMYLQEAEEVFLLSLGLVIISGRGGAPVLVPH